MSEVARIAVLLSGSGTTYTNLHAACERGDVPAEIVVVIASRPGLAGIARAEERGHTVVIAAKPDEVNAALSAARAEWVVMAGWLKFWDPPAQWQGKTLNVHPSLLPNFGGKGMYGHHVHEAVVAAGAKHSGCTVHDVSGDYDTGPILAQAKVSVLASDTPRSLADRVQAAERGLYPQVIAHCIHHGRTLPLHHNEASSNNRSSSRREG
jgi:phosphoribosylglycinamide formyltransferase-1